MTGYRPSGRRAADIAADVEAAVVAGRAPAGAPLPPVRALAADLGVAPGTVAAAYRLLSERGVVEGNRRAGTRIAHRPLSTTPRWAPPPPGTRDLAAGNPDPALLPDPRPAFERLTTAPRLYGGPAVLGELAELARASFAADGIPAPAVTVTSGALDAIERTLQARLRPGMRVAVEDPGYTGVLDLLGALGLVVDPVAVDAVGMLPDGLGAALHRGAQAVIVTPRAHNPTGAALTPGRAAELAAVLRSRPVAVLIEDDHAGPLSGAATVSVQALRPPGAPGIVVRSASKALGPDLRVALVAGDSDTIGAVEARQAVGAGWVSHILQQAVLELLTAAAAADLLARATETYRRRREALLAALDRHGIAATAPSGLNVWVPVPEEGMVVAGMAARGWAIAAGARYRTASPPGVRVTTARLDPAEAVAVAADLAASLGGPGRTRSG